MRAELKYLHSPDVSDLRTFRPNNPTNFSVFVQAMIGPEGDDSSESFDIIVCTPSWLVERTASEGAVTGMHQVVVPKFDYESLFRTLQSFCSQCEGTTWQEIGAAMGRLGRWEFEGYRPYGGPPGPFRSEMSERKLSKGEVQLLREVIAKYLPSDSTRLLSQVPEAWLPTERSRVRDAVGQELAGTGFDENYEPNARGQLLESLIDFVNRLELPPSSKP